MSDLDLERKIEALSAKLDSLFFGFKVFLLLLLLLAFLGNFMAAFSVGTYQKLFTDALPGKPLPELTTLVLGSQTFLFLLVFVWPMVGLVAIFIRRRDRLTAAFIFRGFDRHHSPVRRRDDRDANADERHRGRIPSECNGNADAESLRRSRAGIIIFAVGRGRMKGRIIFPYDEFDPAVFVPAFRRVVVGDRLQTTHTHGIGVKPLFVDTGRDKHRLHRQGALGGKAQVVVRVADIIGVAFDAEEKIGMTLHHRDDAVDQRLRRGSELILARLKNERQHHTAILAQCLVKRIIIGVDRQDGVERREQEAGTETGARASARAIQAGGGVGGDCRHR